MPLNAFRAAKKAQFPLALSYATLRPPGPSTPFPVWIGMPYDVVHEVGPEHTTSSVL